MPSRREGQTQSSTKMNATDPRRNGPGGFRNGRLQPLRNTSRGSNGNGEAAPEARRAGNASTSADAADTRIAGSVRTNNGAYAYTYAALPSAGSGSNVPGTGGRAAAGRTAGTSTRPSRIESTADSNYRYEYYRDYQSQPGSPSSDEGNSNNRNSGRGGGNGGGGNGRGGSSASASASASASRNGPAHVSFSFSIGGVPLGSTGVAPEINLGGLGSGGARLPGLPGSLPLVGAGFPFGGRTEPRGLANIMPFGRF